MFSQTWPNGEISSPPLSLFLDPDWRHMQETNAMLCPPLSFNSQSGIPVFQSPHPPAHLIDKSPINHDPRVSGFCWDLVPPAKPLLPTPAHIACYLLVDSYHRREILLLKKQRIFPVLSVLSK